MRVKNWAHFQHYRRRRPTWIKVYRELLDDQEFQRLSPGATKLLINLWLVAAEGKGEDGELPDVAAIAWRLRTTEPLVIASLSELGHWIEEIPDSVLLSTCYQPAINVLPTCYQNGVTETETETETERETEGGVGGKETAPVAPPATAGSVDSGDNAGVSARVLMIAAAWGRIPGVKVMRQLTPSVRQRIKVRLKEHPDQAWWDQLFATVQASDFLCGRTNGRGGTFSATLDWVLGPKNLDKVLAGNYDNGPEGALAAPAEIPPFPGPEDPIARSLWRRSYGDPKNPRR